MEGKEAKYKRIGLIKTKTPNQMTDNQQKKRTIRDFMRYAKYIRKGWKINPEFKYLFL
jgi:hypothetical protein